MGSSPRKTIFYVTECVRRYLPDTLQAYLQVPHHSRSQPAPASLDAGTGHAPGADELLAAAGLAANRTGPPGESPLTSASTEALQKQQRFLKAKGPGAELQRMVSCMSGGTAPRCIRSASCLSRTVLATVNVALTRNSQLTTI